MKYLRDYQQEAQEKLLKEIGVFFAFDQDQFNAQSRPGIKYVHLGAGTICPEDKINDFHKRLKYITREAIEQDIKENGRDKIIERELINNEYGVTGCLQDTITALDGYGFSLNEVKEMAEKYIKENGWY